MNTTLPTLPLPGTNNLETRAVLKKTAEAHRYLAELKGIVASIPNEAILINTLVLQEAKDSSEIENIITTHDELYKTGLLTESPVNAAAKEVQDYAIALRHGFNRVRQSKIIRLNDILEIQQIIENNNAGLRKLPGTAVIQDLMSNLLEYINDDSLCDADPLVKMALIHHQFESIHPFYDGNGRTGRIINLLYLVAKNLQDLPVLYLSRYIIRNKATYYRELQAARDSGDWEPWLLYMLEGVVQTAQHTIALIQQIKLLMQQYKQTMRTQLPKIYRQELLNNLFNHPYTRIEFVMNDLGVSRITATRYLDQLATCGLVEKSRIGRSSYYINRPLFALLSSED